MSGFCLGILPNCEWLRKRKSLVRKVPWWMRNLQQQANKSNIFTGYRCKPLDWTFREAWIDSNHWPQEPFKMMKRSACFLVQLQPPRYQLTKQGWDRTSTIKALNLTKKQRVDNVKYLNKLIPMSAINMMRLKYSDFISARLCPEGTELSYVFITSSSIDRW